MARSTAAESEFRCNTVYGLLVDGKSRGEIIQFGADNWKIGTRQIDTYIERARIKLEEDCKLTRPQFLAEALAGLRSIRQQAERRGQLMVATNVIRLQCELIGLTK